MRDDAVDPAVPLPAFDSLLHLAQAFAPGFGRPAAQLISPPATGGSDATPQSRMRAAELRYKTLVEKLPVITFLASLGNETSEIYVNPHIERVLGYTAKEWVEDPILWYQRLHPDDQGRWNQEFARTLTTGEYFRGEYRFFAKAGHVVWIRGEITLVRDDGGRPVFLQGLGYDITDAKEAEEVLRRSKDELERLVEERSADLIEANKSLLDEIQARRATETALRAALKDRADIELALDSHSIVAITDPKGAITHANDKFCAISQYSRDELLGQDHRILNSGYHSKAFMKDLWTTILRGEIWSGELRNRAKDGSLYWVATTIVPFVADDGQPSQFIAIRTDISQRKKAEELAEQRAREVEASARIKGEFLANMSHEIRTPMNGIIATADLLSETTLTAEQREDLETIIRSGRSLLVVINDILDFSKLEAGKVLLDPRAFELSDFTWRVGKLLQPKIAEKDLVYVCTIDDGLSSHIVADETRLGQVLLNIIGNAVKFTPRGGRIAVVFRNAGTAGTRTQLHCAVTDSGIGIAQDKLDAIFRPFSQADTSTTRHFGGTGLGLTVSRALVELMGGALAVESVVGRGTTFSFTIPVDVAQSEPGPAPAARSVAPSTLLLPSDLSVLIAEDNTVNATIMVRVLQKHGLKPSVVVNGALAVETCVKAAGTRALDVIFMDVQMPEMDGFEATAAIRAFERAHARPPCYIVAMTAHAMAGDRERCLDAGMNDYITKPLDRAELDRILSRWAV
jgi:PAS domain S-box-containing protein